MRIQSENMSGFHGGARRGVVRLLIAPACAAMAALAASATNANAAGDAPGTESAWSYGFNDSLWAGPQRSISLSPLAGWTPQCFNCGPAFGTYLVQRTELLSSNTADVSVNKVADPGGRLMGVSGMIVTERLEPDGFSASLGSSTDWVVVGERALDSGGTHSWALLSPDISLDAHWLPIDLYRFEGSSFSMDFAPAAPGGATPEPATWAMMLIGFAGLGAAGYRSSRTYRRSIRLPEGCPR
jgi:PEP-CTERM motif